MNICVFDTETTNAKENPFCYNVGFVIFDTEQQILEKADFVMEQIWNNIPLLKRLTMRTSDRSMLAECAEKLWNLKNGDMFVNICVIASSGLM